MLLDDSEEWRPVTHAPEYYEVSSFGRVRRSLTAPHRSGTRPGKILKPGLAGLGYPFVNLSVENRHRENYVHRLVALAFLDPPPTVRHIEVNHIDGIKTNNHVANLEWKTPSGNQTHSYDTGLHPRGEAHYRARLTENDVRFIRSPESRALSRTELAAMFGIHLNHVDNIRRGRGWRHVD